MSVSDLIREFDSRKDVPVDVNDVLAALVARGIQDEVFFFPVEIDSSLLKGQFVHWDPSEDFEYPTDGTQTTIKRVAAIHYAKDLTDDWQRLVCCKELLHILDVKEARAFDSESVRKLSEKIVLPPDLQDPLGEGVPTVTDRFAMLQAVALLFPARAREILIDSGQMTHQEIALTLDLPLRYVALVMSDQWPLVYSILLRV